jgi:hypothetical protein
LPALWVPLLGAGAPGFPPSPSGSHGHQPVSTRASLRRLAGALAHYAEEYTVTISQDLQAKIRRYFHVEKWRVGTIAQQLGAHHATVDRVLAQAWLPKAERAHRDSLLDPYLPFVVQTLKQYPRLTASRLYAMVRERGYSGGADYFRHLMAH